MQVFTGEKDIFYDFNSERIFNSLFSYVGIEDFQRGLIWIKLLSAEELRDGAEPNAYRKIVEAQVDHIDIKMQRDDIINRSTLG